MREEGCSALTQLAREHGRLGSSLDGVAARTAELARQHELSPEEARRAAATGWGLSLDDALADSLLSEDEERHLLTLADAMGITTEDLVQSGGYNRAARAKVLRQVIAGTPEPMGGDYSRIPFNLQKNEMLVWLEPDTTYHEMRTKREWVGGSQGVSLRIMRGVYYRAGAFKAQPINTTYAANLGTGLLGFTTKHLYFAGEGKTFRVAYSKIISFEPYTDGFGIMRDAATAKPQIFVTGDGWFTYNLVTNLAQLGG